jgi:hypothetical protein
MSFIWRRYGVEQGRAANRPTPARPSGLRARHPCPRVAPGRGPAHRPRGRCPRSLRGRRPRDRRRVDRRRLARGEGLARPLPRAARHRRVLLLVTAPYLRRRRQSALRLGLGLLLGLTVLDLLKLDVEAATGSLAAAVVLWLGRHSFYVRHDPHTLRSALRRVPLLAGASLFLCGVAMWIAAPEGASLVAIVRATGDALLWRCPALAGRTVRLPRRARAPRRGDRLQRRAHARMVRIPPLPLTRGATRAAGRRGAPGRPGARAPSRGRHARLLQAAARPALPLQPRQARVPRVPRRGAC